MHLSNPQAALAEARRVLAPGGRIVLLDSDNDMWAIDSDDIATTRAILALDASPCPAAETGAGNLASVDRARLEAFNDGVLAVAITLLTLDLPDPRPTSVAEQWLTSWPGFAADLVSFLVVGVYRQGLRLRIHADCGVSTRVHGAWRCPASSPADEIELNDAHTVRAP